MFTELPNLITNAETVSYIGKIENIVGMSMEASGNRASIGDIAMIYNEDKKRQIPVEVVGFKDGRSQLMAYENMSGISAGSFVRNTRKRLKIPVGEFLRGRIIDALGNPMDDLGPFESQQHYYVENPYINPLTRPPITDPLEFGIKAIDGLNTVGKGQRIGIFAGSGVGKSTLLGMIARNVKADINVIALVGERGREVREFIEKDLGPEGLKRSVLVVATSDQPAMLRMKCPLVATTIAEYFKDQGKDVLLMMDSLTRFAMAQREIGLATGEPPVARGYTPSIYAEFPKLLERSGKFEKGSITGIYTVLVEGDDTNEPIADTVRGIVDGHIVLSRKLANENHFPAIDVNASISRLMVNIVPEAHQRLASQMRDILSIYTKNEDLISIGAYKAGTNPRLDAAVGKIDAVNDYLMQRIAESFSVEEDLAAMRKILN
ncbi:MAG: flagellar protein export ATPase FliI [Lachnospiraceae bacterium]|mgnify:FL=1|jgi:flagellum-specific ATP synthase|uniref:flagellar protein export ATPase FliI n=1 Tax=Candidatus Merdisoma sp. JLR.KK006 TaxID=3112626 RepID=UPI002FF25915|nr:flagellar protein export ATPase FliI [Lachnospiraceae bacterium]